MTLTEQMMTGAAPMTPTDADREAANLMAELRRRKIIHPDFCCEQQDEFEALTLLPALKAAEERGARMALEAAADWVDGKGGRVIPGATVFVPVVTGDNQPCMSGDMRDRLHSHKRRAFDDAMRTLSTAIRQIDPAAIVGGQSDEH